ncbi:MAG: alpha/beta hydrolase [Lachnospiraceae bacterium]|nr:alpha/beta hydrolase [Lachnospiraceae bacterium]
MNRSLKYRILLKVFRIIPIKRIMAQPAAKTQKLFKKACKGVKIPKLQDPGLLISKGKVDGSTVLYVRNKKGSDRLMVYLVGGGMLKYPMPSQVKEVGNLAKECKVDVVLPYYPLVYTGSTIHDVYEMIYDLYKKALKRYKPENICLAGGSSGGNLALGLVSYINDKSKGIPIPGKIYAGSPGTLLLTKKEKKLAECLENRDVIMSVKAIESIWDGMSGGKDVPDYMRYLQLGDYTGLKDVYLSFGGDEVFLAGAESIKRRLEDFGVKVTLEIGEGLYHCYAMMPLVEDAEEGYRNFRRYIAE